MSVAERLSALVQAMKQAGWKEREALKDELLAFCREQAVDDVSRADMVRRLEGARREVSLEVRWEIDEVLEALAPEPEEPEAEGEAPEAPEEPEDPNAPLRMSDLKEVYADPRGLILYTDKPGKRWFVAQPDPYTGQPMMAELPPHQIDQVKAQLKGSPYWTLGSGVVP